MVNEKNEKKKSSIMSQETVMEIWYFMLVLREIHKLTEFLFVIKTLKTVCKVCSKLAKKQIIFIQKH